MYNSILEWVYTYLIFMNNKCAMYKFFILFFIFFKVLILAYFDPKLKFLSLKFL